MRKRHVSHEEFMDILSVFYPKATDGKTVRELCECGHGADACAHSGCRAPTLRLYKPAATDQRVVAERRWQAGLWPSKPQVPCDHGLFSDEASQLDLVEMLQDPTND